MRLLIQQVKRAEVTVNGASVGKIGKGFLVFLGIHREDTVDECLAMVKKMVHLRIFPDQNDKMNLSLEDVAGELLIVSQFTLYANCNEGRRPSFIDAARPDVAKQLYERFIQEAKAHVKTVQTGQFGAAMEVSLINDGPSTFLLESKRL